VIAPFAFATCVAARSAAEGADPSVSAALGTSAGVAFAEDKSSILKRAVNFAP
jgi:hypothetical protein